MKKSNSTIFYFISILLLSLGSYGETQDLNGVWKLNCDRGLRKEQVIENFTTVTTEFFHQDKYCNHESFRFKTSGTIQLTEANPTWIDFTYTQVELTVFIPDVVADFNLRQVCGFTDWAVGEAKVITGLQCALFNVNKATQIPKVGDLKYGIYKIENDRLYYGQMTQKTDGSSFEKRPTDYATEFLIK